MIITIAHQKGGVGKSTVALNLAILLKAKFVIDLDIQKTLTMANEIRVHKKYKKIDIRTFSDDESFKRMIKEAYNSKEVVIIDCGGFDSKLNRVAIFASRLLLTPVSDKGFELLGLKKFNQILEKLSEIKKDTIKAHVFFNNINANFKSFDDLNSFVKRMKNFELMDSVLRTRIDFSNSCAQGLSVGEYNKSSKAYSEIKSLAKEIKSIIY